MQKKELQVIDSISLLPKEIFLLILDFIRLQAISNNKNINKELSKLRSISKKFKNTIDQSNFYEVFKFQKWQIDELKSYEKFLKDYKKKFDDNIQEKAANQPLLRGLVPPPRRFRYVPANQQSRNHRLRQLLPHVNPNSIEFLGFLALSSAIYSVIKSDFLSPNTKAFYLLITVAAMLLGYLIQRNIKQGNIYKEQQLTFVHDNNKLDLKDLLEFFSNLGNPIDLSHLSLHELLSVLETTMISIMKLASQLHDHIYKNTFFLGDNMEKCINDLASGKLEDLKDFDAASILTMHVNLYTQSQAKLSKYASNIYLLWKSKHPKSENTNPAQEQTVEPNSEKTRSLKK